MKQVLFTVLIVIIFFSCKKEKGRDLSKSEYKVIFTFNWNDQDFSTDYPSNAHFSPLIGWSHDTSSVFFKPGTLASVGIKDMAERGKTTPLDLELNARITNGEGYKLYQGDGLGTGFGEVSLKIDVSKNFPAVTIVSMLAPSPDWFIAALNVNLLQNGVFVKEKKVDVLVYDAGTDDGATFTSANTVTSPQQPISVFVDDPLGNGIVISPVIATAHFIKQ